jgi:DNA repair protein RecO (recombination protein O)
MSDDRHARIAKDAGLVLRFYPWSNSSRIIVWLCRENGRIATLIKGSQRPKSLFLGQYDLFYTDETLFYRRDRQGLHILRECSPLRRRDRLRSDWRACAAASYLADLTARSIPMDSHLPGAFERLAVALDALDAGGPREEAVFRYELALLDLLGLKPRLGACASCRRPRTAHASVARFSVRRGGLVCGRCHGSESDEVVRLSPDTIARLAAWQDNDGAADGGQLRPAALREAGHLLGRVLRYHLDLALPSRDTAFEWMSAGVPGDRPDCPTV